MALIVLALTAPGAGAASEPRLEGTFAMDGTVTRADHVRGERKGDKVSRTWSFAGSCTGGPCDTVALTRDRAGGQKDHLTLHRTDVGKYSGNGRFFFAIRCAGRAEKKGGEARFKIAVRVTQAVEVQGKPFASDIVATYDNTRRINHTQCHGNLGSDAARYTGKLKQTPAPPSADFSSNPPSGRTVAFEDHSTRGSTSIAKRHWDFGDPASGSSNTASSSKPSHTFTAPGTYTVALTVTDRDGLTDTVSRQVVVT